MAEMIADPEEVVMAFDAATEAIRAEKLLIQAGLCPLVMPLPSRIKAGCGICLRIRPESLREAKAAFAAGQARCAGWFLRRPEKTGSTYERLGEDER